MGYDLIHPLRYRELHRNEAQLNFAIERSQCTMRILKSGFFLWACRVVHRSALPKDRGVYRSERSDPEF